MRQYTLRMRALLLALVVLPLAQAQFTVQSSGTQAGLRGIAIGDARGSVAFASGTGGTILHTTDAGAHWTPCTTPPDAASLDFRAVQAFDANTALSMSSGGGAASRVYKTVDDCRTW